ncbi:hypothetical protein Hanom_Chr07g00643531 [Helianthus anomalus]
MSSSDEFNFDKVVKGVGLVLIFGVLFAVRLCRVGLSDIMVELFDPRKMVTDYDCSVEETTATLLSLLPSMIPISPIVFLASIF